MAARPTQLRTAALARLAVYVGLGLAAVGGIVAYGFYSLNAPPTWSDLPDAWFERPAAQDPASWALPGAKLVRLDVNGVRVQVIPEMRDDVVAELVGKPAPLTDGAIVVTGAAKCPVAISAGAPLLVVHTPLSVRLEASGVFSAEIGPADALMISSKGCGAWRVTGSHHRLWLVQDGPGTIDAAAADEVRVATKGAAVIRLEATTRSLDAVLHGPSRLDISRAEGSIDAQAWGRGRIAVASGFTSEARMFVKGPGAISHAGTVGALTAEARNGGKIKVAHVRGLASGSGDVQVSR